MDSCNIIQNFTLNCYTLLNYYNSNYLLSTLFCADKLTTFLIDSMCLQHSYF